MQETKILMKDTMNTGRDVPRPRKNIVRRTSVTRDKLQIQCNTYQITNSIFTELEQKILKFVWKHKEPQLVKAILSLDLYFEGKLS